MVFGDLRQVLGSLRVVLASDGRSTAARCAQIEVANGSMSYWPRFLNVVNCVRLLNRCKLVTHILIEIIDFGIYLYFVGFK